MNKVVKGIVGLLGLLVLLGLGISSCGLPEFATDTPFAAKSGDPVQLPERTVHEAGDAQASPSATPYPASPSPTARDRSRASLPLSPARPALPCTGLEKVGVMNGLSVVRGGTSGAVTWTHIDGALRYLVAAVPVDLVYGLQPPVTWQTVAAPATCGPVNATVSGLIPAKAYIFWLRAVTPNVVRGGTTDTWVARSIVVTAG